MLVMMTQREQALVKANEVKMARAEMRRSLQAKTPTHAEARVRLADALVSEPLLQAMTLSRVLGMCHGIHRHRTAKILQHVGASHSRKVGDLTDRQMSVLLEYLRA